VSSDPKLFNDVGSPGIAVKHSKIWRQLHCWLAAVQLLAQLSRQKWESHYVS